MSSTRRRSPDPSEARATSSSSTTYASSSSTRSREPSGPQANTPRRGACIGRHRVLGRLGAGGVGVVYAAFDQVLARNVAIKLLRPSSCSSERLDRRRARLLREARALARLSHPNVVPVFEIGWWQDQLFVAMELIEGPTLREWSSVGPRPNPEILRTYVQAGRGLAAAHDASIIHRDFKPDNAIVGADGRVRVLDFGLATPAAALVSSTATLDERDSAYAPDPELRTGLGSRSITADGSVIGTPAYMSPEQSRGEAIDARSDQYSFCVALWEALYGESPLGPLTATRQSPGRRERRDLATLEWSPAIAWSVRRALRRGTSLDPRDRYADMHELLEALERPVLRRLRGWLAVAGLLALAVSLLVWATA